VSIVVQKPGLQTTIQSSPRTGQRHLGVPASGPADPLSMALANRLVGNTSFAPALETTLTGVVLTFRSASFVAITGATAACTLNGEMVQQHATIRIQANDVLAVGPAEKGVRSYVAFAGGLCADKVLNSMSTYTTAGFGGFKGRALATGDELELADSGVSASLSETPAEYRLPMLESWTVRAGSSVETSSIDAPEKLFSSMFTISSRSDRMGIKLDGMTFATDVSGQMPSVPVFPGTVQCPQDGSLFVLAADAGTTGGYPRVAKIARLDLHLLGQLRQGDRLALLQRSDEDAARELREKHSYWRAWLPDIADVV
jgi:5-oxoprolinase (ATP-hydrolysing) subunit C